MLHVLLLWEEANWRVYAAMPSGISTTLSQYFVFYISYFIFRTSGRCHFIHSISSIISWLNCLEDPNKWHHHDVVTRCVRTTPCLKHSPTIIFHMRPHSCDNYVRIGLYKLHHFMAKLSKKTQINDVTMTS